MPDDFYLNIYRTLTPLEINPVQYILDHPGEWTVKVLNGLLDLLKRSAAALNPFFIILFIAALIKASDDRRISSLKWLTGGIAVIIALPQPFFIVVNRYFIPLAPIMALLIAPQLIDYLQKRPLQQKSGKFIKSFFWLAMSWPLLFFLIFMPAKNMTETGGLLAQPYKNNALYLLGSFLCKNTERGDVIMSDMYEVCMWHCPRQAIWFTMDFENLELVKDKTEVDWILLTNLRNNPGWGKEWHDVMNNGLSPPGFQKTASFTTQMSFWNKKEVRAILFRRIDD